MSTLREQTTRAVVVALLACGGLTEPAQAGESIRLGRVEKGDLRFKADCRRELIESVPPILKTYDAKTGHFGQGVWICRDQDAMYPLAAAYASRFTGNEYYKSPRLLTTLMKAGDALIADADKAGKWVFRKKDNSTWGTIWMPWTYSRWIRTFALIRDDMPADRRTAWEKALTLGYSGISKNELKHVHNIPTHHAMSLYIAGKTLNRPEWCTQATEFMHKVAAAQSENGYWSEGEGPVVLYNFVYVDALGTYYAVSKDEAVVPALAKAAAFHRHFTYPNGFCVETIDQRNPLKMDVSPGNVGFTFTPAGRAFLDAQWTNLGSPEGSHVPDDMLASLLLYGQEGPAEKPAASGRAEVYVLEEKGVGKAMTIRQKPWFVCLSAMTTPVSRSRWIQDRQNFVSVYHDVPGCVIVGGGNTKLQPAWSNFTVGDTHLLQRKPADTNPEFMPKGELYHVPSAARLVREPMPGLDLIYGPETCSIRVRIVDDARLEYVLSSTQHGPLPVVAHVTLVPTLRDFVTETGRRFRLGDERIDLTSEQIGNWFAATPSSARPNRETGCPTIEIPTGVSLHWPMLGHNPYAKDGAPRPDEARIELRLPFDGQHHEYRLTVRVE